MKGRRVAIPSVGRIGVTGNVRLIKGKRYNVLTEHENSFEITAETGVRYLCLKGNNVCHHLQQQGSWKLLTERK